MKYVINAGFDGFRIPAALRSRYSLNNVFGFVFDSEREEEIRTDSEFIGYLLAHPDDAESLKVVEIPDSATDWELSEIDGWEAIIAVVDGKLVHIG